MDHEKHIVKMSPLKYHRPVGEFSILEDEEQNPTREAITERWPVHCYVATYNFGRNTLHENHASELL